MKHCHDLWTPLVVGFLLALSSVTTAYAQNDLEDKVKTAFVYNFAKFIDWPAVGSNNTNFNICIAGRTSLGELINRSLENKSIKGRSIHIQNIGWAIDQLDSCHMLYLNGSDTAQASRLLQAANSKPILTIGETDDFIAQGGIIQFLLVDDKVRFIINQVAANSAGLSISAKLLEVAFHVRHSQGELKSGLSNHRDV